MMKLSHLFPLVCLGLGAACSSVRYGDPNAQETLTRDFGSYDLKTFSRKMVEHLSNSPGVRYVAGVQDGNDPRTRAVFGGIANETHEHINTDQISREMQSQLVETGLFRWVAGGEASGRDEVAAEVRYQQSGVVNPAMAIDFGKQINAQVVVYGVLSDIDKSRGASLESGGVKRYDLYYQLYMAAVNVETNEILWAKTEDIRKTEAVGPFGR
jgi:uncharacterized protein (TIGR02722 family)